LNALASDPTGAGTGSHHEANPSLSGLSEIGVSSAPQIVGGHGLPERGNIDS
jgi:hypothetical protein